MNRRASNAPARRTNRGTRGPRSTNRPTRTASSRPPKRRRRGGRIGLWLAVVSALTAALVGAGGLWIWGSESVRAARPGWVEFRVDESDDLRSVAERLESMGLLRHPALLPWYQRLYARDSRIEPGQHVLADEVSPRRLIELLARRMGRPIVAVSLPEGWDSFQMARRFAQLGVCSQNAFLAAVFDERLALEQVGQVSFEGYLYPATYSFRVNSDAAAVVARLLAEARLRMGRLLADRRAALAARRLTEQQWVVLASIVEKEAADPAEMPSIASVFHNRLSDPEFRPRRMLQSDPTAGYGCKLDDAPPSCSGFSGKITPALLRDPQNAFNTYRHAGLPPTPIGNPAERALLAVLDAPPSDDYFFVIGSDGRHHFSRTLQEHNRAIGASNAERQ